MTRDSPPPVPVLRISNLSKTFFGAQALRGIDFELRRGEIHALVGQNGSGKSTLVKVLAGFHQPDPGARIELDGNPIEIQDTGGSQQLGLRFVHQDLALVNTLDTVENLALGSGFPTGRGRKISWRAAREDARTRLGALGYDFDVRRPVGTLGAAERTGVAIARALRDWRTAKALVIDEPTASLPRQEVDVLFRAIEAARSQGVGVIYVSHRLDEVFTLADRVTVLRDGLVARTCPVSELDQRGLIDLMIGGADLDAHHPAADAQAGEPLLEVRSLRGLVCDGVDFVARRGEVLGIAGLTGSGREEILRMLFGALPREGQVLLEGREVKASSPPAAMAAGLGFVPADRHRQGSHLMLTVAENCTLTDLRRYSGPLGALSRRDERSEVRDWIASLDVRPADSSAVFATLSGGNQQKVVLAKWLRVTPRALLLDEPTQGVDVQAKATIHQLARGVADRGSTVVIASSDDEELCDVCDRVLVIRDGAVVSEVGRDRLSTQLLGHLQLDTSSNA